MFREIWTSRFRSKRDKWKNLALYYSRCRGAEKSWRKSFSRYYSVNPHLKRKVDRQSENDHIRKWSVFKRRVNPETFRISTHLSGSSDPAIVPQEIFLADIEPTLNNNTHIHLLTYKSYFNRWFRSDLFPADYFHRIDGQYYDAAFVRLTPRTFAERMVETGVPVVVKPNRDTYGGAGVRLFDQAADAISYCESNADVVVQEVIRPHAFFQKYYSGSLNTVRACLYKSVADGEWKFLFAALRMGKGGSLDNITSGGIATTILDDGTLNRYAVDLYGTTYRTHPDTQISFNEKIPDYEQLKANCLGIAEQLFMLRIVSLDMCYDVNGIWRIIEVNTMCHTINFSQHAGLPFFRQYTDEVIDYCRKNHWAIQSGEL